MLPLRISKFVAAIGLAVSIVQTGFGIPEAGFEAGLSDSQSAWAQSGGRTRGGSFDRPTSPEPPSYSAPSRAPSRAPSQDYTNPYDYSRPSRPYYPSQPDYFPGSYRRPPVIVVPPQAYPVPADPYGGQGSSDADDSLFLVLVVFCGICLLPVLSAYLRQGQSNRRLGPSFNAGSELSNDIVTVTQLQVGLLAQARFIQEALTQLSLKADLETQTGLTRFLQETVLALLRSPENWTHAKLTSQTVHRQQAAQLFEQLSIQVRSKLSAETLVNVGGQIQRQALSVNPAADPASYIVVNLLLGTADDRPFAQDLHSAEALQTLLKRLGGITPDYLLIFELIWSPQDPADSLSRDQLLTLYPDLIQIA